MAGEAGTAVEVVAEAAEGVVNSLPVLGAGLGFREPLRAGVFLYRDRIGFLEITADHYLDAPARKLRELDLLAEHFTLIPHGLDLSLGSAGGLDLGYLKKLATLIRRVGCPWWSEHIAFMRAGGVRVGHLAPLPYTREAVDTICRNLAVVREAIERPLILENIAYQVVLPGDGRSEPEFLAEILERSGCGLLLDVANLHANAINHGFDPRAWLDRIPLDRVVQLHFAGGHWKDGELIDSHSRKVDEAVWDLMDAVLARAPVRGVVLERDEKIPPIEELLPDLERVRRTGARHGLWN
ncbi:MAG: DUF692 domain-containing protein [Acidobacteria bacterium]|nr:DUF692 domain-containing protein [Acidobacteriota bacterium]